jgi:hypothetical protein
VARRGAGEKITPDDEGCLVSRRGGRSPLEFWLAATALCLSTLAILLGSAPLSTIGLVGTAVSFGILLGTTIALDD